jgi:DbpA RNA binding domain
VREDGGKVRPRPGDVNRHRLSLGELEHPLAQSGVAVALLEDFHLLPSVAKALDRLGWTAEDPATREAAPTAARGHNLIGVTPPAPVYATPGVAGALSRVGEGRRALLLSPPAQIDEWGDLVHRLAEGSELRIHVARGLSRAMRLLRSDAIDVLVATLDTASALLARSALKLDSVTTLFLFWPESWPDEDALTPLMQDLPKDAQRIIYTADAGRVGAITERYARKALTIGLTGGAQTPAGPVRTVSVGWRQRVPALADLLELLDPATLAIWTVDRSYHDAISRAIRIDPPMTELVAREAVTASTVIAFDLPSAEQLRDLQAKGSEVVLLVPPGTDDYAAGITTSRRPIQLSETIEAARTADESQRARIAQVIQSGRLHGSVSVLAPLFERHDPVAVAAALLQLLNTRPVETPTKAAPEANGTSKVFVGAGKKDGVTPNDLVAVLTKELRVDRQKIGRIELRDSFSLIEIPSGEAEQVARGLNGSMIRRRKVTARVDRGASRGPRKPRE